MSTTNGAHAANTDCLKPAEHGGGCRCGLGFVPVLRRVSIPPIGSSCPECGWAFANPFCEECQRG